MRVYPFDTAALAVAYGLGGREFALLTPPWVIVDDCNMPQTLRHRTDFFGIICGISQVVEIGDACGAHLRQRNGSLAVMQADRGQDRTDGYVAIDYIQM